MCSSPPATSGMTVTDSASTLSSTEVCMMQEGNGKTKVYGSRSRALPTPWHGRSTFYRDAADHYCG
jgi:hypothetical protein